MGLTRSAELLDKLRTEKRGGVNLERRYAVRAAKRTGKAPVSVYQGHKWLLKALERAAANLSEEMGARYERGSVIRRALIESVGHEHEFALADYHAGERSELVGKLPTFMITPELEPVMKKLRSFCRKRTTLESDYIRSALAYWLTKNGYGP